MIVGIDLRQIIADHRRVLRPETRTSGLYVLDLCDWLEALMRASAGRSDGTDHESR